MLIVINLLMSTPGSAVIHCCWGILGQRYDMARVWQY